MGNSGNLCPFDARPCDAVNRQIHRVFFVALLLAVGAPLDIAGFIPKVVVNPVNAALIRWALANIGNESFVRVPCFAHRNAAPAIVKKKLVLRISAPVQHRAPDSMFRRSRRPPCVAVFDMCSALAGAAAILSSSRFVCFSPNFLAARCAIEKERGRIMLVCH